MLVATPVSTNALPPTTMHIRPRVLLIGQSSGDPEADASIRSIADVTVIPRLGYAESIPLIRQAAEEHGPFDAFAVSLPRLRAAEECVYRLLTDWEQALLGFGEPLPRQWDERLLGPLAPDCGCYAAPGAGYDSVDVPWMTST